MRETQLFYNLVKRDALLICDAAARHLEGPFDSREEAERAAEELVERLETDRPDEAEAALRAARR